MSDVAATANSSYPLPTVAALVFNEAGEVLLLQVKKWNGLLGLPAGKVQWGESLETALRREIREETSLSVDDVQFFMVQELVAEPQFRHEAHFVSVNYTCKAKTTSVTVNDESTGFQWCLPEQALQRPLNRPTREMVAAYQARIVSPDRIVVEDLRVDCIVGVNDEERTRLQPVLLTLEMTTSIARAARSHDLSDTIDYFAIAEAAKQLVVQGRYLLLETMAEDLASMVFEATMAVGVRVLIKKPQAIAGASHSAVEIVRHRQVGSR